MFIYNFINDYNASDDADVELMKMLSAFRENNSKNKGA